MMESLPKQDKTLWHKNTADGQAERQSRWDETERLARCAMRGDRQALSQLCRAIAKGVLFSVRRLLPGYADADDVAQEVLIRMCAGIHSLKDPKAFGGWLNGIEVNEARRHMAKETKHQGGVIYFDEYPDGLAIEEENEDFLPQEYTLKEEECRIVVEAIDALPARQREAVILHYYKGIPTPSP